MISVVSLILVLYKLGHISLKTIHKMPVVTTRNRIINNYSLYINYNYNILLYIIYYKTY